MLRGGQRLPGVLIVEQVMPGLLGALQTTWQQMHICQSTNLPVLPTPVLKLLTTEQSQPHGYVHAARFGLALFP